MNVRQPQFRPPDKVLRAALAACLGSLRDNPNDECTERAALWLGDTLQDRKRVRRAWRQKVATKATTAPADPGAVLLVLGLILAATIGGGL